MGRPKKTPEESAKESPKRFLTPDDMIYMLAIAHAQTLAICKTLQAGFATVVTSQGARPDVSLYPDATEVFMEAFDSMTGETDEAEIPEPDDAGATTG
jgi:hypothetical protein